MSILSSVNRQTEKVYNTFFDYVSNFHSMSLWRKVFRFNNIISKNWENFKLEDNFSLTCDFNEYEEIMKIICLFLWEIKWTC